MFGGITMVTKKDRLHSGYVTPKLVIPKKEFIKENLFLNPLYDEWENYRDGFRDWYSDFKLIKKISGRSYGFNKELYEKRIYMNKKQKMLLKRRKVRLNKTKQPF